MFLIKLYNSEENCHNVVAFSVITAAHSWWVNASVHLLESIPKLIPQN